MAVLEKLVAKGEIQKQHRTVVISTANGLKFPNFKVGYHEGTLPGIGDRYANRPHILSSDYEVVKAAALGAVDGSISNGSLRNQ